MVFVRRATGTSLTDDQTSQVRRLVRAGRFEAPVAFLLGIACLACSGLAAVAALVGLWRDGADGLRFAALAALWFAIGGGLVHQCRPPDRIRSSTAFVGAFVLWLSMVAISTVTYEVLGVFTHLDDAVFESVAGFTTTASTVVADPEAVSRPVLTWRAGTQWLGGLGGLLFVVAVLPSIGVGGLDVTTPGHRHAGTSLRSRRTVAQLRRLAELYATLTGAGVALYLLGGMSPFDAVTYAATTISTGGFANHAGSFGHFESVTVEWAGIGGMVLGGANLALVWRAARGLDPRQLLRSFELRAYLSTIVVVSAVIAVTTGDGEFGHTAVRQALFHVTSAVSTTGHFVGEGWGVWAIGPQVLLLALMGVGAMSGSSGGGFRMVRALALLGYLRRELTLQLHPRAVGSVRVGRRPVAEALVNRMVGYQVQYLIVAAAGAFALGTLGTDLVTAMSASISAIANVGPGLGDLVPLHGGVLQLPRPARAAMMPLMLLGRLEIAPVLVGSALAATSLRGVARRGADAARR